MFKNYVNESLDLPQYNQMMLKAPKNQKYCNAFCQKFIDTNEFYDAKANCKECFNYIIKIRKMIDNNQLTAEQFKASPDLIKRDKVIIPIHRTCITCEEELTIDKFEATRKEWILKKKAEMIKKYKVLGFILI